MKISIPKKVKGIFCCVHRCTNKQVDKKGGMCHKHYARKIRENDPVYARYNQFCSNARRRKIKNSVTLEEFRLFCERNNYIIVKYRRGKNCTIDRRCNVHGYHIWNMQILSQTNNTKKYHNHDKHNCGKYEPEDDLPF